MKIKKPLLLICSALLAAAMLCACNVPGALEPSPEPPEESETAASVSSQQSEESSEPDAQSSLPESKAESSIVPESSAEEQSSEAVSSAPESSAESEAPSEPEKPSVPEKPSEPEKTSAPESSAPVQSQPETPAKPKYVEIEGIKLTAHNIILYPGDEYTIFANMIPDNATRNDFKWEWTNTDVISMNSDGLVKAKKEGTSTITAITHNGKTDVCEVEVRKRPPEPEKPKETKPVYKDPPVLDGSTVSASWFDDAVFVGDSVSNMLYFYSDNGCLGDAEFLTIACLGYNNALWDIDYKYAVHPSYKGKKVTVDEGVRLTGKKKVFIMLGMNDIGGYGVEGTIDGMKKLTDRILSKSPDVQIYIQSVTPLIPGMTRKDMLNNANVAKFNKRAAEVCEERGFVFVNVAEAVSDLNGALYYKYCSDPGYMGLHMNYDGCEVWVNYLKSHVA